MASLVCSVDSDRAVQPPKEGRVIVADVRILDNADLDAAVAVLARGIREIPLYRWLLGEHADDLGKRAWLAKILLLPLLRAGCVAGAEVDGRLVGVLAWQPHDLDLGVVTEGALTRDDFSAVIETLELLERLRELWTEPPLPPPVPDGVNMILVTVLPEVRGGDVLADLVVRLRSTAGSTTAPRICGPGRRGSVIGSPPAGTAGCSRRWSGTVSTCTAASPGDR